MWVRSRRVQIAQRRLLQSLQPQRLHQFQAFMPTQLVSTATVYSCFATLTRPDLLTSLSASNTAVNRIPLPAIGRSGAQIPLVSSTDRTARISFVTPTRLV